MLYVFTGKGIAFFERNTLLINHFQSGSKLWVPLCEAHQQVVQTRRVFKQHLLPSPPKHGTPQLLSVKLMNVLQTGLGHGSVQFSKR